MKPQTRTTVALDVLTLTGIIAAFSVAKWKGVALYVLGVGIGSTGIIVNVRQRDFLRNGGNS